MFWWGEEGSGLYLDLAVLEIVQYGLDLDLLIPDHGGGQLKIHKERFHDSQLKGVRDAETWSQESISASGRGQLPWG